MNAPAIAALSVLIGGAVWLQQPDPVPAPLRYSSEVVDGHHLLADDPAGSGRVVEALGDLDGADDIAVLVPGTGQNRGNFRRSDGNPGTVPLANGRALLEELRRQRPDSRAAVVVWLGYLPPQDLGPHALTSTSAREGAAELVRFDAWLPEDAHVTLVCHSYGSVVCGEAARHGGVADDVVALGSPGMGVGGAEEVRARVWATRADDDWIRFVPSVALGPLGYGSDPMDPDFGARVFFPGPIHGHESYYRPGSASLEAIARIALGDGGELRETTP
ncbi:hypothetical protein GCM10022205_02460 [Spinactinospora alkalitolerans]